MSRDQTMVNTSGVKRQRGSEEKLPTGKRQSKEGIYMRTALLVDYDITSRLMEQQILVLLGIETLAMNSAQDALQILLTSARFDIIVVDFDLPQMNGPEFVRHVRAMGIRSKILGLCINYNPETRHLFYAAGVDAIISKPVMPGILGEVIGHLWSL